LLLNSSVRHTSSFSLYVKILQNTRSLKFKTENMKTRRCEDSLNRIRTTMNISLVIVIFQQLKYLDINIKDSSPEAFPCGRI
jgi:uridine kinase